MQTDETLLMLGDRLGSVAAVRNQGESGIGVVFADHRRVTPGGWSRYVTRRVTAPSDLSAYAVRRAGDPAPAPVDLIWSAFRFARHPRAFVRSCCLDG